MGYVQSEGWAQSKYGRTNKGEAYEENKIVLSSEFRKKAGNIMKVEEPLIKVLR